MTGPRITDVLLHADEQQELQERYTKTEWASHEESFSICSPCFFYYYAAFSFPQMHTLLLLHGVESKSRTRRGGHTATFLSMLCWLGRTLPLRGWWGGMALWREPAECIYSCHHHLNPGLLNLQLWPPTWMGNDLSVLAWHPLRLQRNHSPLRPQQHFPAQPCQHGSRSASLTTDAVPALNLQPHFSSMAVHAAEPIFLKEGGVWGMKTKNSQRKNTTTTKKKTHRDLSSWQQQMSLLFSQPLPPYHGKYSCLGLSQ